jgi:thiamine-phosphate pyrophosphorylase
MTDLRERLSAARLYLCTDGRRRQGDLAPFLDSVLAAGVDIVQLREKNLEASEELALLEVLKDACRRHHRLLAVNDRADLALAAGADVLHLGQDDLPVPVARQILGPGPLIGRSSHDPSQSRAAADEDGVDYFCAGPVWATPTKPGRPGTGLALLSRVHAAAPERPWFAIGGIGLSNLDEVLQTGARRVVVVRAITEAGEPGAAAAEFARRLASPGDLSASPLGRSRGRMVRVIRWRRRTSGGMRHEPHQIRSRGRFYPGSRARQRGGSRTFRGGERGDGGASVRPV